MSAEVENCADAGAAIHDRKKLIAFINWLEDKYDIGLCAPSGHGEVVEVANSPLTKSGSAGPV